MERICPELRPICIATVLLVMGQLCPGQHPELLMNEQGTVVVRDPQALPPAPLPRTPQPPTVKTGELPVWELSLDEAIRIALENTDAIRVLSGVGAASTG